MQPIKRNQHSVKILSEIEEDKLRMDIYNYLHSESKLKVNDILIKNNISQHIFNKYLNKIYEEDRLAYRIKNGIVNK